MNPGRGDLVMQDACCKRTTEAKPLISEAGAISLVATLAYAIIGWIFANAYKKSLSRADYWVTVWLVFDILIHATLELPFVVISLLGTVNESDHFLALTWKEYALADARWGVSDPTIVSLEILTVTIVELFAVVLVYAILYNKFYRHFAQIFVCVCELYGGWLTFCPEWLTGSKNLVTNDPILLWLYLVFFNGLWVVIPVAMLWQSWSAMGAAYTYEENDEGYLVKVKKEVTTMTNTYHTYNTRSKSKAAKGDKDE